MLRNVVLGAVLMATFCAAASATQAESADFRRSARVSIGADGKVTALTFDNTKAENDLIGKRLEPLIRSWTFQPGTVNGQPMPTETTLQLDLEATKTADGRYAIKLLNAFTGPGVLSTRPPDYPQHEFKAEAEAVVNLTIAIDATGAPSDVTLADVTTNGTAVNKTNFGDAARNAAKGWRFQPELVGGHPVASHVSVPISFCMSGSSSQCPRFEKERAAHGDATPANTPVALDSKVKLISPVVGTTF